MEEETGPMRGTCPRSHSFLPPSRGPSPAPQRLFSLSSPTPFPLPDISSGLLVWLKSYFSLPSPPHLPLLSTQEQFPFSWGDCLMQGTEQSQPRPSVCSCVSSVKSQASVFCPGTWGFVRRSIQAFPFALLEQILSLS